MPFKDKSIQKEESLSDKRYDLPNGYKYAEKDVKEFINRDWKLIDLYASGKITYDELIRRRNKIFGEKLTK